jgi:DNA polymerase
MTKKWEVMETHGARLFENSIQAISRDCLMFAVMNMENAGGAVCLTVHDELVLEVPKGKFTYDEVKDIMTITPPWAKGLNLRADGFIGSYYKK